MFSIEKKKRQFTGASSMTKQSKAVPKLQLMVAHLVGFQRSTSM